MAITSRQWLETLKHYVEHPRAPVLILMLLAALLIYTAGQILATFLPPADLPNLGVNSARATTIREMPEIGEWHLFGRYQTDPNLLPKTTLALMLQGIFFSNEKDGSQALISAPGKTDKLYNVGEQVPGGAIVKQILHDSVILEQNNKLTNLPLKAPKLEFAPAPRQAADKLLAR